MRGWLGRWLEGDDGIWAPRGGLVEPSNLLREMLVGLAIAAVGGFGWLVWKAVSWAFG